MEKINKYLDDNKFIHWVFNSDKKLEDIWKLYEINNPGEKRNIQLAREILTGLKTQDRNLSQEERMLLFAEILKQIEDRQKPHRVIGNMRGMLKYAAVALLFFAVGALLFYRQDNFDYHKYTQQLLEPISDKTATLIRPSGKNIVLEDKKSVIEYKNNGQIMVNNDIITHEEPIGKGAPTLNQLIIPYGKSSVVLLSDSTKVYLNAGSRLVYPDYFNDKNREVFLIGEAFFNVKHNEKHPFIVQTADLRVRVLGTKFNVSAYPSDQTVETVLTEGKVKLEENKSGILMESTELLPNQLASFNKTTGEMNIRTVDPDDYTLWTENLFKFESIDLSRIIKKLERYYNIRFRYGDPLLGTIKISGKLELEENVQETLSRLAVAASVEIVKNEDNVYEIKN